MVLIDFSLTEQSLDADFDFDFDRLKTGYVRVKTYLTGQRDRRLSSALYINLCSYSQTCFLNGKVAL